MAKQLNIKVNVDQKPVKDLVKDLGEINNALSKTNDSKSIEKLNKDFKETKKSIDDVENSVKSFSLDEVLENTNNGTVTLKAGIRELENEMQRLYHSGQNNTEEFKKMQQAAADMRSSIANLNRETNLLGSNDSMQHFADGLGNVGKSLKSLDFVTAAKDANALAAMSKNMSFKTATDSLKNLGKTFASVGKALLTNPLFLLAAVLAGIVAILIKVMKEMGVFETVLDGLKTYLDLLLLPIELLIQGLKDLADFMGWTNFAAQEMAEKSAEASKKMADEQEKSSNKIINSLDNEIALMEAKGELSDEDFEKILAMEAEKRNQLSLTAKARMDEAEAALQAAILKGNLDEEELQALKDKRDEAVQIYENSLVQIELGEINADKKRKARLEKQTNDIKAETEKREQIWKQYQQNRINAERQTFDLINEIKLLEAKDADEKMKADIDKLNKQYERLIEDTLRDENILQSEKEAIIEKYEKIRELKEKEIRDKRQAEIDKEIELENIAKEKKAEQEEEERQLELERKAEQDARLRELRQTDYQNQIDDINNKYALEMEAAKGNAELLKALDEQRLKEIKAVNQQEIDNEKAKQKAKQDAALSATATVLDAVMSAAGESSSLGKAAAIAGIAMDTYQGAMAAYSAYASIPIVGPILGAAAAAGVGVMGAMNIKKVNSTKTPGKKGGGGGGNVSPAIASAPTVSNTPDVNLFGNANETSNESNNMGSVERGNNNTNTIRAVVSWSDLDAVSNNDNSIQNEMQL